MKKWAITLIFKNGCNLRYLEQQFWVMVVLIFIDNTKDGSGVWDEGGAP